MSFRSKNGGKFSKCISIPSLNKTFGDTLRIFYRSGAVQTRVIDRNDMRMILKHKAQKAALEPAKR